MHNVAATFAMGIKDPAPVISGNSAAITTISPLRVTDPRSPSNAPQIHLESRDLSGFLGCWPRYTISFPRPLDATPGWRELVYSRSDCGCHWGFLAE